MCVYMSTFALRLVNSDNTNVSTRRDGDNSLIGHLLGVFVSLDTDRDSLINKAVVSGFAAGWVAPPMNI